MCWDSSNVRADLYRLCTKAPGQPHQAEARANQWQRWWAPGPRWSLLQLLSKGLLGLGCAGPALSVAGIHETTRSRGDGPCVQMRAMGSGDRWVVKFKEATPTDKVADVCMSMQKAPEIVAMGQGSSGGHCHTQAQVQAAQLAVRTTPMPHYRTAITLTHQELFGRLLWVQQRFFTADDDAAVGRCGAQEVGVIGVQADRSSLDKLRSQHAQDIDFIEPDYQVRFCEPRSITKNRRMLVHTSA
jgi:hypothetical protein